MSEQKPRETSQLGGQGIGAFIPVDPRVLNEYLLKPAETAKRIKAEHETSLDLEEMQLIENVLMSIRRSLMTKGHLVVSIVTKEAFAADVQRKVALIYALVERIVDNSASELSYWLEMLHRAQETGDYELLRKASERIDENFRKIYLAPIIALKAIDDYMGLLQLNLPIDLMPNTIKAHLGVITT